MKKVIHRQRRKSGPDCSPKSFLIWMHIRSRMAAAVLILNEVYLTWFTDRSRDRHRQAVRSPPNDPTIKPEFMVDSLRDWHRWTLFLFHRSICEQSIKWVFYRLSKHHSIKEQSQNIILVRLNAGLSIDEQQPSRHCEAREPEEPGLIPLV